MVVTGTSTLSHPENKDQEVLEVLITERAEQDNKYWEEMVDYMSKWEAEEDNKIEGIVKAIEEAKAEGQKLQQSIDRRKEMIAKFVSGLGLKDQ